MKLHPTALAMTMLLVSCATTPKIDLLEAKARGGDPVAACQLAAHSLRDCALEQQSWETNKVGSRPACVSKGIDDQQEAYLDKAGDKLSGVDKLLFLTGPRIQLLTAYVMLVTGPSDKAVRQATEAQQSCDKFAEGMTH